MTTQERYQVLAVLQAARKRIVDPAHWCQRSMAVDAGGCSVTSLVDPEVVAWCAMGAVLVEGAAVARQGGAWTGMDEAELYLSEAAQARYGLPLTQANDTHGHAAVLELYDTAIARAQRVLASQPEA